VDRIKFQTTHTPNITGVRPGTVLSELLKGPLPGLTPVIFGVCVV
jgi:hypothetical protein